MNYNAISIQGNILTSEILEKIRQEDTRFQAAKDFNLNQGDSVRDEINLAWSLAISHWNAFKQKREALSQTDTGTTETRRYWMLPLFQILGYDVSASNAEIINDKSYAVSHRANNKDSFPIHIIGIQQSLDKKAEGARLSSHALIQEYLNNTEHLYGFTSNGAMLRVLRDATRLSRLSYIEFNLEQMMEEGLYVEFALLYRTLHGSRIANKKEENAESILEWYHQEALSSGSRIRERLSESVYMSILELGNGFIKSKDNSDLISLIEEGKISSKEYYGSILKLIYRLLFLMVIEERNLIYPDKTSEEISKKRYIYTDYYSLNRIIKLASKQLYIDKTKNDLWFSMLSTFKLFEEKIYGEKLGIHPLGFGIFKPGSLGILDNCSLDNESLMKVIDLFSFFKNDNGQRTRVNYADLNVEELGSVYEGLLALHPKFNGIENNNISFSFADGNARKESASYYTNSDLVGELIKSTLVPIIETKLEENKESKEKQLNALLSIKVCDPSVGSGHMLLAAARTIAYYVTKVKTDGEPTPEHYRESIRQVIQHCLYGVDYNPEAVELCKLALWLEGYNTGMPLSFLDHKIKNGNSLVGIANLDVLKKGIPSDAYTAVSNEDARLAQSLKRTNSDYLKTSQVTLQFVENLKNNLNDISNQVCAIEQLEQNTLKEVEQAKNKYEALRGNGKKWYYEWVTCNLWVAPFFANYNVKNKYNIPLTEHLDKYINNHNDVYGPMIALANSLSIQHKFFHWPLEYPEVFAQGGFDVMLGNPPWERVKLQEKEFFKNKDNTIVEAANASSRKKQIAKLEFSNPELFKEYESTLHNAECFSKFLRSSNLFPLTGRGDVNMYATFAELFASRINQKGASGLVVPTGIATDDGNKFFFASLIDNSRLVSLFDFENKKGLFPAVHRSYKFSLLTIGENNSKRKSSFGFFLHDINDLNDKERIFSLSSKDFLNINPNTKTTPIFRTRKDAELTAEIYSRIPILINNSLNQNPWDLSFKTFFHMSNDSHLFKTESDLLKDGYNLKGNRFIKGKSIKLPLYESKFIWHYDHRFGTYDGIESRTSTQTPTPTELQYQNPSFLVKPWYWIDSNEYTRKSSNNMNIGFRDITNNTNERTSIFSVIPKACSGNTLPIVEISQNLEKKILFLSLTNSLIYDYTARQKIAGMHMTYGYVYQFSTLSPLTFKNEDINFILSRISELIYTSWDLKSFLDELWVNSQDTLINSIIKQWEINKEITGGNEWVLPEWTVAYPEIEWKKDKGCPLPPFKWDESRRAIIKAELDAYFALLYGLERDDVLYILDPQDALGKEFPGETFRGLKDKDTRKYGEYRTKRLVLEAYDKLRPTWDMPTHLEKLKTIWEECQVDLSEKKKPAKKEKVVSNVKTKAQKQESNQVSIFDIENNIGMKEFSLNEGIYSILDAANIIKQPVDKVRRWFKKLSEVDYEGLEGSAKTDIENRRISFHGLIELVVIGILLENGSKIKDIITARKNLKEISQKEYPFATNNVRNNLKKSGVNIIFRTSQGDVTLDGTSQFNLDFIYLFFDDIIFENDIAVRIMPIKGNGEIIIDPKLASGKPSFIKHHDLEVEMIVGFYEDESSIDDLIENYSLTKEEIEAALSYSS